MLILRLIFLHSKIFIWIIMEVYIIMQYSHCVILCREMYNWKFLFGCTAYLTRSWENEWQKKVKFRSGSIFQCSCKNTASSVVQMWDVWRPLNSKVVAKCAKLLEHKPVAVFAIRTNHQLYSKAVASQFVCSSQKKIKIPSSERSRKDRLGGIQLSLKLIICR